jgi:hypothetical protein
MYNADKFLKGAGNTLIVLFVLGVGILMIYTFFFDPRIPEVCAAKGGVLIEQNDMMICDLGETV